MVVTGLLAAGLDLCDDREAVTRGSPGEDRAVPALLELVEVTLLRDRHRSRFRPVLLRCLRHDHLPLSGWWLVGCFTSRSEDSRIGTLHVRSLCFGLSAAQIPSRIPQQLAGVTGRCAERNGSAFERHYSYHVTASRGRTQMGILDRISRCSSRRAVCPRRRRPPIYRRCSGIVASRCQQCHAQSASREFHDSLLPVGMTSMNDPLPGLGNQFDSLSLARRCALLSHGSAAAEARSLLESSTTDRRSDAPGMHRSRSDSWPETDRTTRALRQGN